MGQEKISILYIDDDVNNLNAFKATFRADYKIFIAPSAKEGFEIIKSNEIHIVFADQRMPEMTGVEFFEMILKDYPNPIRILITGYTDIESVVAAINKGQIYRYISKPWNDQELRVAIENAFEIYDVRQKLYTTNKELTKRNDELNRFVYSASHELKAPLRTIAGILKMAQENKYNDAIQYFTMIDKCVNNLDSFIKNIVDYYRNQRYEENLREINFDKLIKEVIANHMFFENVYDINFNVAIEQKERYVNDEFRIRIIISNLLSNCIKYQKKGNQEKKISIKIHTDRDFVFMAFEDTGIGIPSEYLGSIFNMFFRATDHSPGTGIGLYIVKEAIEKMHGNADVKSIDGEGTKFMIQIPNRIQELTHGENPN
jgi:two-component system, sensor histidine kinase and response regulator